ncbi:hypothetical protein WDW86_09665 [Bdellovibrionota bacterium FG-2]
MKKALVARNNLTMPKKVLALISAIIWGISAGYPINTFANAELDHRFALESIGFLKAWDNVDGLFAEYVSKAYQEYFTRQSRFVLQDLSKTDPILGDAKIPYYKLIDDTDILKQVARKFHVDSLVRTKIQKEGRQYRFTLDWLHAPNMELISTESFVLQDPGNGKVFGLSDIRETLQHAANQMIMRVPFLGHVTGRDGDAVTTNIGASANIYRGDILSIGTLEETKLHPLLKSIVDWRFVETGKLVVEDVEERIAFCRIKEEDPNRKIARYQKVLQAYHAPASARRGAPQEVDDLDAPIKKDDSPHMGFGSAGLWLGRFSRTFFVPDDAATGAKADSQSKNSNLIGTKAEAQLWLSRQVFGELGLGYAMLGSERLTALRVNVGYNYFVNPDIFGPKGWVKAGFQTTSYSLQASDTDLTAPTSFKGFCIGTGGDIPLRNGYGAMLNLDFGVLTSGSQTGLTNPNYGDPSAATAVSFFVGAYYRKTPKMTYRVGLDVLSNGGDFATGASLTHNSFALVPALIYYF